MLGLAHTTSFTEPLPPSAKPHPAQVPSSGTSKPRKFMGQEQGQPSPGWGARESWAAPQLGRPAALHPGPQTCVPGGWLPDGQPSLPALAVSAKFDAITTKPLYFLQTTSPFVIS